MKTTSFFSKFILKCMLAVVAIFAICMPFQRPVIAAPNDGKKPYFVLLRPDTDHPFWALFEHVMIAACHDIGCDVDIKFAHWDHFKMVEQAKELGALARKPDMVFFQSFKQNGAEVIKALDAQGINAFLVNAGLTPEQAAEMGKPREKYKHWVGQMMPDDFSAGAMTAKALYEAAKAKGYVKDGKVYFVGIEGNSADGASIERLKGLNAFVAQHDDLELLQVVQGKWETDLSHKLTLSLLRRYPDVHVIWAAGDPIAFGVVDAANELGLPSGQVLTAGVDWAPRALEEIQNDKMVGSAGGHFMEGAWSAITAYDYVMGHDFKDIAGLEIKSVMGFLDKETLPSYTQKYGAGNFDSVDFKAFSRAYNKDVTSYVFDISGILK